MPDPEAELLDEVIPVEQLDRVREGPLADPADGRRAIRDEEDAAGLVDAPLGAERGEALGEARPRPRVGVVEAVGEGPAGAAGPLGPAKDEPELDLHVGAAGAVVDHRAIGLDPDHADPTAQRETSE
jgi:hypothetical protein